MCKAGDEESALGPISFYKFLSKNMPDSVDKQLIEQRILLEELQNYAKHPLYSQNKKMKTVILLLVQCFTENDEKNVIEVCKRLNAAFNEGEQVRDDILLKMVLRSSANLFDRALKGLFITFNACHPPSFGVSLAFRHRGYPFPKTFAAHTTDLGAFC